jgi:hypothetical protein
MKSVVILAGLAVALVGCTTGSGSDGSVGLQPIPGSITYGGQPRSRLTKSPVGSVVQHEFRNEFGQLVYETYVIQPDRSLRLSTRRVIRRPFGDDP